MNSTCTVGLISVYILVSLTQSVDGPVLLNLSLPLTNFLIVANFSKFEPYATVNIKISHSSSLPPYDSVLTLRDYEAG